MVGTGKSEAWREMEASPRLRLGSSFEDSEVDQVSEVFQQVSPSIQHCRIVTLAYHSDHLPVALLSEQLATSLVVETGASVALLRLRACEDRSFLNHGFDDNSTVVDWASPESVLRGQFRPASLGRTAAGYHVLVLNVRTRTPSQARLASVIGSFQRNFQYLLVEAPVDLDPSVFEVLKHSDLAYHFFRPAREDADRLDRLMRSTRDLRPENAFKPVLCLGESGKMDDMPHRAAWPSQRLIRGCPSVGDQDDTTSAAIAGPGGADIRRLAREISGRSVGLALSSGASKGFAHIGVIQVLEEHGIEVDYVAGASIGAYIGALWTYGHDGKEIERLARELEGRLGFWRLMDPIFPPRQGFLKGLALRKRLMRSIGSARFEELPRPLRVVAGNLANLERTVFSNGQVAEAVHASMAVPGICVPVTMDGEAYIDGGIVDPVPVDVLREMGAAHVIAVNTLPSPQRLRDGFQEERGRARRKESYARRFFRRALPLDKQLNYFARGNLFEIVVRSVHGAQVRLAEASCRLADIVLRPDIRDDRWLDCRNPRRFIALGREAAEQQLEQIKALAGTRETTHESEPAPGLLAAVA